MAYQFMLKKRKDPESKKWKSEAFIYLRYSFKDYSDCLIATGKKRNLNEWDEDSGKATGKGASALNDYLSSFLVDVQRVVLTLEREKEFEPTPDKVKERWNEEKQGSAKAGTGVFELWEEFVETGKANKAAITTLNEADSLNTFKEFCKAKKKDSLSLRKVTKELIHEYEVYLNKFAANTKAKRLKHFKAFLRSVSHPCTELVKFKEVPGDKIFLTEEELTAIEAYNKPDLTPMLAQVRDLLVLQCETGLRVSDLMRVGAEHIQAGDLILRAKKNDRTIRMPVSPRVAEILARYNYQLPHMADQTYNDLIKDVAQLAIPKVKVEVTEHRGNKKTKTTCHKWEVLTSHCSVRTYITLAAGRGMPIPSIAALTGKSVQTLLRSYLNANVEQAYKDALTYARPVMKMAV